MSELTTVPTFIFEQGDVFSGEVDTERFIQVKYWNQGDSVELNQAGNEIMIRACDLKKLFREIQKHLPEATKRLKP